MKETLLVVCPGRGSYTRDELGYLNQHRPAIDEFIFGIDEWRRELQEPTVTDLDKAEKFSVSQHTVGENASVLIYACAMADFLSIDRERFDVVAVTGNSMGWYLALAAAGALNPEAAFRVINTMGSMMKHGVIGGQIIYPIVDEHWIIQADRVHHVHTVMDAAIAHGGEVYESICLGGYMVLGGDEAGLRHMLGHLDKVEDRYPFKLVNHAAFHTPMLAETSAKGFSALPQNLFQSSTIPMIDGRGNIWQPWSLCTERLRDYTLGHQVVAPYDFSAAIRVGMREFAPDRIVLLGPGDSLGGAIGQVLIEQKWQGISNKQDFIDRQKIDPILLSMGREDQRKRLIETD